MTDSRPADSSVSPDVDKGWAFVVLLGGFCFHGLSQGLSFTTAIFYTTFLEEFNQSPSMTAWAINLNTFTFYFTAEIANFVIGLVGHRRTFAIGAALSTTGLLTCCFATHLIWIFLMYGVVTGVGFSFGYFSFYDVIPKYFRKYRLAAYLFVTLGTSAGQFLYPPLIRASIDKFHWRGAFLLLGGLNLNLLVVAAIMMPPRLVEPESTDQRRPPSISEQLRQQLYSVRLLKRPRWALFCISLFFTCVGISGFFTHISKYAEILGYSKLQASALPSVVGIAGICGRLCIGAVAHCPRVHIVGLYMTFFSLIGVANIACGLMRSYIGLVISSFLCGACVAGYGIYGEVIIHIVGLDNVAAGVSYCSITGAVGLLVGGPFAALIYEADPSYVASFLTIGLMALLGALLNFPSWISCRDGRLVQRRAEDDLDFEGAPELKMELMSK